MKYLMLLLLVSCASKPITIPNCQVTETGIILDTRIVMMECFRPITCEYHDDDCRKQVSCTTSKNDKGLYTCVRRD